MVQTRENGNAARHASLFEFERRLYDTRRQIMGYFRQTAMHHEGAYVCSLSGRTIVYKGMLRSVDLPRFFVDLRDSRYETTFAVYHRRFSTNTMPKWYLAQPSMSSYLSSVFF